MYNRSFRVTALFAPLIVASAMAAPTLQAQAPATGWTTSGTVDAGFVSATGNTDVTTISFGDKYSASLANWTFTQYLAYVYGKTKGVESANQLRGGLRAAFTIFDGIGAFTAVVYERNTFAGFNRRLDELLGLQWKAIADSSDALTIDLGGVLTQQDNLLGITETSQSARVAGAYRHTFKPNTFLTENLEYVENLKESGTYRANSETALVAPLSARISVKLGYVFQYNSRPPASFGTTDRVFTSGLQISF